MKATLISGSLIVVMAASILLAQEPPSFPPPVKEHKWLEQFVGEWDTELLAPMGPNQEEIKVCTGTMQARMLGAYFVISEYDADMMGTRMNAIQTVGYDPEKKQYIGTWVDNMQGHMWKYQGTVDETGKILTLEADGPDPLQAGKTAKFRDAYEFKSKDDILATSSMLHDGEWVTFMKGHLRRKAKK